MNNIDFFSSFSYLNRIVFLYFTRDELLEICVTESGYYINFRRKGTNISEPGPLWKFFLVIKFREIYFNINFWLRKLEDVFTSQSVYVWNIDWFYLTSLHELQINFDCRRSIPFSFLTICLQCNYGLPVVRGEDRHLPQTAAFDTAPSCSWRERRFRLYLILLKVLASVLIIIIKFLFLNNEELVNFSSDWSNNRVRLGFTHKLVERIFRLINLENSMNY